MQFSRTVCRDQNIFIKYFVSKENLIELRVWESNRGFIATRIVESLEEGEMLASMIIDQFNRHNKPDPLAPYKNAPLFVAHEQETNKWSILYGNKLGRFDDTGLRYDDEATAREVVAKHG